MAQEGGPSLQPDFISDASLKMPTQMSSNLTLQHNQSQSSYRGWWRRLQGCARLRHQLEGVAIGLASDGAMTCGAQSHPGVRLPSTECRDHCQVARESRCRLGHSQLSISRDIPLIAPNQSTSEPPRESLCRKPASRTCNGMYRGYCLVPIPAASAQAPYEHQSQRESHEAVVSGARGLSLAHPL